MRPTSAAIAFALIALTARLAPSAPADAPIAGSQRSILVRGAYPVRGLPFFAANALPALVGDYSPAAAGSPGAGAASPAAPADVVTVWFTREALVLGSSWKRTSIGGLAAYVTHAWPRGSARPRAGRLLSASSSFRPALRPTTRAGSLSRRPSTGSSRPSSTTLPPTPSCHSRHTWITDCRQLTVAYFCSIFICMRTTLVIADDLVEDARARIWIGTHQRHRPRRSSGPHSERSSRPIGGDGR